EGQVMFDATFLIETAAKSLVVSGAALGLLHFTGKRSAAERSLIGHLGLIALIVLPAISLLIPGWNPLPVSAQAAAPAVAVPAITHVAAAPTTAVVPGASLAVPAASAWAMPTAGDL